MRAWCGYPWTRVGRSHPVAFSARLAPSDSRDRASPPVDPLTGFGDGLLAFRAVGAARANGTAQGLRALEFVLDRGFGLLIDHAVTRPASDRDASSC